MPCALPQPPLGNLWQSPVSLRVKKKKKFPFPDKASCVSGCEKHLGHQFFQVVVDFDKPSLSFSSPGWAHPAFLQGREIPFASPSLDYPRCIYVFLGLRSPELDAVTQECWKEGNSHFFSFSHQCQDQHKDGSAQLSPSPLSTILSIYPSQIKKIFPISL